MHSILQPDILACWGVNAKILLWKKLLQRGADAQRLEEVFSPIGVNIGADTPEEIAVSVVAEMVRVRRGVRKEWKTKKVEGALVEKKPIRYAAAACQVDRPNPTRRAEIGPNVDRMLEMVDMAVEGYDR